MTRRRVRSYDRTATPRNEELLRNKGYRVYSDAETSAKAKTMVTKLHKQGYLARFIKAQPPFNGYTVMMKTRRKK